MLDLVKKLFGKEDGQALPEPASAHDIAVAACALLLEMSGIDGAFTEAEKNRVLSLAKEMFTLSDEEAAVLIDTAERELEGSLDLWQFARMINTHYSREEKEMVVEMVWRIAYADGRLHAMEDHLVHKIADLLQLNHRQLIDAKIRVISELGIYSRK
ncbi:MAG: TerB family tellurite resistance protein [Syntrophales bacterium]|jgi:uncharacterized tellurite resistance protein B-like protein|nr:TerB family tellurite resistance protein [Syntrophales bacterium]MDY0043462.1 TerB family tellurite resistance protein [Syntrophales bacterium]